MVFSVNTIKNSKEKIFPDTKSLVESQEASYITKGLCMILEESKTFRAMIYSNDKNSLLNINEIISNTLDSFILSITKLEKSFELFISDFTKENIDMIDDFKLDIAKFDGSIIISKPYYEYRNFKTETSYTTFENEINKEYNIFVGYLFKLMKCKSNNDISSLFNEINIDVQNDIDIMKGKVLGLDKPVSSGDIAKELFSFFRTSYYPITDNEETNIKTIDKDRIKEAYNSFYKVNNQKMIAKRNLTKMKLDVEKAYSRIKDSSYKMEAKEELISDIKDIYNHIVINYCKKIKAICDIYIMLYSAKLDAMKEYDILNKYILMEVSREIVKEG